MTDDPDDDAILAELADDALTGPAWDAWLAARPAAAVELATARRVRLVLAALEAEAIVVPADFEARLRQRLREDATLVALLDLGLANLGRALLEVLEALLALLPAAPPAGITPRAAG
jgi:hypothetical protein